MHRAIRDNARNALSISDRQGKLHALVQRLVEAPIGSVSLVQLHFLCLELVRHED